MSLISSLVRNIKPSPTLALTQKAKELQRKGVDVIPLTVGEPDFQTPPNVVEVAIRSINEGFTKYTEVGGIPELKISIQKKFAEENDLDYDVDEIIVSNGGKQVIYNLLRASINPGDEVIIPAPYWVSYVDMVILAGGTPVVVECGEEDNFKINRSKLRQYVTSKTKWLILNSPSNPTGMIYTKDELEDIAEVLRECRQVHVLSDDIYEHIMYEEEPFYNMAMVAPDIKSRVFIVNGVSKAYAMTGWRIGYGAGDKELIKAMTKIQSQCTSSPCSISQKAAREALSGPQEFIKERSDEFQARRNYVITQINDIRDMNCIMPKGAFYLFPSCKKFIGKKIPGGGVIKDSASFAEYLLNSAGVAVVPGSAFGMEGYFRMSYALSKQVLMEACARIREACDKIHHHEDF